MPLFSFTSFQIKNLLPVCLLILLTLLSFSPVLRSQFLTWGDQVYLTENINLQTHDLEHFKALLKKRINGEFIPLSNLSFAIEHRFFGLNPFIFHLDNLLLHLATVIIVFLLLGTFGLGTLEAFLASLIFAVHPTKVEAVAWVADRKDVLCALFYMASLLNYQRGKVWFSYILGILSLLSAPMALSLPLIMLLLDWYNGKGLNLKNILSKWFILLAAIFIAWKSSAVFTYEPVGQNAQGPLIVLWSLSFYITKFFTPIVNLPIYSLPKPILFLSWNYIGPLLILASALLVTWFLRREKKVVFSFIFFFLSILFLLHMSEVKGVNIVSDRYLYIPSLGLCLLSVFVASQAYQFLKTQEPFLRHLFLSAILLLIAGLMLLTFNQSAVWKDTSSLWQHQIKLSPHPTAYNNLAAFLNADRKTNATEIISLYKKALEIAPHSIEAYYNLANFYKDADNFKESLGWYNKALLIDNKSKEALFGLGLLYQKMDKSQESIDTFKQLLKFYPDDEDVYINLTDIYTKAAVLYPQIKAYQEQREDVLSEYEELSKRKKYSATEYYNLGFLYEQVGGFDEAIHFYKKSLEIKPSYEKALYNLANRYQEAGDMRSALYFYERLIHYHPKYSMGYLNMGVVYNALGDVNRARMLYHKAIDVDPHNAGGYFNLGFLSESKGDLKEALGFYEKAVEIDPQLAEGYYNLGNVYAALGQKEEAIASYLKTIAISKTHQSAYVNLSILSFKAGDFADAIHYLDEAQKLGYTPPEEYLRSLKPYRKE